MWQVCARADVAENVAATTKLSVIRRHLIVSSAFVD
jgi:hypothetical protein